jgi:membrane-associated phospholipid phosphatase
MNETFFKVFPAEELPEPHEILRWGIEVIKIIQKVENPHLTALIKFITELGTEKFYIPAILFIFWWIDEKRGLRLGIIIIISAWLNSFAKSIFKQPRPFSLDPSLGLAYEPSYGAPSGHAQMSLTFWIPIAAWCANFWTKSPVRRFFIWALAILFILLIGFTRLYLGVHFPSDLFAGWLLGAIVLAIFYLSERLVNKPPVEEFYKTLSPRFKNIAAAITALAMNSFYPADKSLSALLLGFCLGYSIMRRSFPFHAQGSINGKKPGLMIMILRSLTGFSGLIFIYIGLRLILPGEGSLFKEIPLWGGFSHLYEPGRFIRYGFLGLWASAGAPMVFRRLHLASNDD